MCCSHELTLLIPVFSVVFCKTRMNTHYLSLPAFYFLFYSILCFDKRNSLEATYLKNVQTLSFILCDLRVCKHLHSECEWGAFDWRLFSLNLLRGLSRGLELGGWGKKEGVQGVDPRTNGNGLLNDPTSGTIGQQLGPWKAQTQKSQFWKQAFVLVMFER